MPASEGQDYIITNADLTGMLVRHDGHERVRVRERVPDGEDYIELTIDRVERNGRTESRQGIGEWI